jgi:hypothetical protein
VGAEQAGKIFALLLLSLPASFTLLKTFRAPTWPLRIGRLSLVLGFTLFIWPETVIESLTLGPSSCLRVALGLTGLAASFVAIVKAPKEAGSREAACYWGGGLSVLSILIGLGLFTLSLRFSGEKPGTEWTYHSPGEDFSLRLPSSDWVESRDKEGVLLFTNKVRLMRALSYGHPGTEEAWRTEIKKSGEDTRALESVHMEEGRTPEGNPFHFTTAVEVSKERKMYVAVSHFWIPSRKRYVVTFFEGLMSMKSEGAMRAEMRMLEDSARSICLSVQ